MAMRPELAAQVAIVVSTWSYVETSIGRLLSFMMGVKSEVGIAMYLALSGSAAQDAVLDAVAKDYFSQDRLDIFHAIRKCSEGPRRQRNLVVHGLWGYNQEMPDSLLWLPPQEALKVSAVVHGVIAQHIVARSRGEATRETTVEGINLKHVVVYRQPDFDSIFAEIRRVNDYWDTLLMCQQGRAMLPSMVAEYDQRFQRLSNEPPILAVAEKIRRRRQNAEAKP